MSSLHAFPDPPSSSSFTICEKSAELVTLPVSDTSYQGLVYPDLNVTAELRRLHRSNETARSAFMEPSDTARTRLLEAWYEHGISGILEELTSGRQRFHNRYLVFILRHCLSFVRMASNLHGAQFPHLAMSNNRLIENFAAVPNWPQSVVRCFAWHPHAPKYAVGLLDDSVCIHQAQPSDIVPMLKHKMQKGVSDIAWKPMSASVLAIACQSCIVVWTVDPMSLATRPSNTCAQVLSKSGHCPVVSVCWSPLEELLFSASPTDNTVMIWRTSMDAYLPLKYVGQGGVTLLRWSPDGCKLFTGCPTSMFRIWKCENWTSDKWTTLHGRCQAACWSSDGGVLLFATVSDPLVYMITFDDSHKLPMANISLMRKSQSAIPVLDLSPIDRETGDVTTARVGGIVQDMVWDQNNERLAIVCQRSSTFIALFQTRIQPTFEMLPCGFIRGLPQEEAISIRFKPTFSDGSLLTVVWSTGRIVHIPLYYAPRHNIARSLDVPFYNNIAASAATANLFST